MKRKLLIGLALMFTLGLFFSYTSMMSAQDIPPLPTSIYQSF
jgi:hypothetical protein